MDDPTFDQMLALAAQQTLTGWDFSWLNARTREEPLPWDYHARVHDRLQNGWTRLVGHPHQVDGLMDVGTGGGEFFAGLIQSVSPRPEVMWATEGYSPNVPLARQRLEPLGVRVLDISQREGQPLLEVPEASLDLIIDRHEGISGSELARMLRPGGRYITQQVGGQNCLDINHALQDEVSYEYEQCTLDNTALDLEEAGLVVLEAREAFPAWQFQDIAGLVFYLNAVPWQVAGFTAEKYRDQLYAIHQHILREGSWTVREHRFFFEAEKQ